MSEITNENYGSKPHELFGTYTWKIEKFSEINEREKRSNAFEIGGYKWYILAYPRGCDVCDHLSLFLCVANYDKLLPGWSHLAQFTLSLKNKDPKKSKYSDTLHRFWKKEHDWGWKKFIQLPKLQEGFIDDSGSLIIKVQVQVIRESVDRLFPCLDFRYRMEVVRIYRMEVETIFLRFMKEKRRKLIEDKTRWTSLWDFWLGMDQDSRREMSREKMDVILKRVVKHFFIKNEVASTFVMDSLFYGLKSIEENTNRERTIHTISKQARNLSIDDLDSLDSIWKILEGETNKERAIDAKEWPAPMVSVEKDMFVLADDAMLLLEKAVLEPSRDEWCPQNRVEVGSLEERDEKLITEFGRRTLEVFVLDHIFLNKIEIAYKEAFALKMQIELIRVEEEKEEKNKSTKDS